MQRSIIVWMLCCMMAVSLSAQGIKIEADSQSGGLMAIRIENDTTGMNWIVRADRSQYAWIDERYAWGLGYFTVSCEEETHKCMWRKPVQVNSDGTSVTYLENGIRIGVWRTFDKGDLLETYTFTNENDKEVSLYDIGIYTPINDNYPNASASINRRAHAHIWEGGSAAYICALRMGNYAPHLGIMLTEGALRSYEIWGRGRKKGNSHTRGIIAVNPPDLLQLRPGQSYTLQWRLFTHAGRQDFLNKILKYGGAVAHSDKYVYTVGETVRAELTSGTELMRCMAWRNGIPVAVRHENGKWIAESTPNEPGEVRFDFYYGDGKQTHVECLVMSPAEELIKKRADFILSRQQMNVQSDLRYGAYMVYDNEADSIYLNDRPNVNPVDRDEGAERVGMGVMLAKQYLLYKDEALKTSLLKYADFIHNRLQSEDYITYSSVDHKGRIRAYNYVWIADFYFYMYKVTADKKFAEYGYNTLRALYSRFGHGFYAIGIPVCLGLEVLKDADMRKEYKKLLKDFTESGDVMIKNGLNYPKHEVNYEQSIVGPALQVLTQLYLVTGQQKYLDEATRQMPVLDAFNGFQPTYHKHEIAIRHWDGYWFGKREMFGDTFPHYWSTVTGAVYHYYGLCTGDKSYQKRAEEVVRNNLCLFFEDGKASCAYLYPYKVNGIKAAFYDAFANDQDWALVYYYLVNKSL